MTTTDAQLVLDVSAGTVRMTRKSFVEGSCNSQALSDILTVDFWDAVPRILIGPSGSGKTHLTEIFAAETGALRLRATRLAADSVPRAGDAPAVVLDQAERLRDAPLCEEIAFHIYNQARDLGQPLLIAGRGPIASWGLRLPDLLSRMMGSAQIRVSDPDMDTLRRVLDKLFTDRQLAVPAQTVEYALYRMERSFEAASRLVRDLDQISLSTRQRIDRAMIRTVLHQEQEG